MLAVLLTALACAGCSRNTADSEVVIRYDHIRTCTHHLGRTGQFFVYQVTDVANNGSARFIFDPAQLRFVDDGSAHATPIFIVPEFSELEVAPGARETSAELYLLERGTPGAPPPGPLLLRYDASGVRMARGTADPKYDQGSGCAEFNT